MTRPSIVNAADIAAVLDAAASGVEKTEAEPTMQTCEARVRTEAPARYLGQLCKHFAHKIVAARHLLRFAFRAPPASTTT